MTKEKAKLLIKKAIREGFELLTSVNTGFGVIIGGLIANNTLFYHTGLTASDVDVVFPCAIYFVWTVGINLLEQNTEWQEIIP